MSQAATKHKTIAPSTLQLAPPLKWAGGKRWLIGALQELYSPYHGTRLVEPFAGGLAVALGLNPKKALLNDRNPHLINFYKHLAAGLRVKGKLLNERKFYLRQREKFNNLIQKKKATSAEAAQIFYFLNRTGFNGLCRFNSKGEFNVPFGRYTHINYRPDFLEYASLLKRWTFTCKDFEQLNVRDDDFLYVDPPYDVEFTRYAQHDFTWEDQQRLVEWLRGQSCPIVASNQATERIIKLYKKAGFKVQLLPAPRRISCTGDRSPALEMLATRNF
ncbi:MAG: Dam family site-specific DNA-(adenine-N6)-methyltransferase [Oligoflexia bacterium]|nr:Dam family site-specific DNA-(adenine-N6)-methyltransferase [Oligoflexia bacterium]